MHQLNIGLVAVGILVLVLGLVSKPVRRAYISALIVTLLLDIVPSPVVLGLLWLQLKTFS